MRITFLSSGFGDLSGGARVNHIYASALQARGHQVTIVAPPQPRPSGWAWVRRLFSPAPPDASMYRDGGYRRIVAAQPYFVRREELPDADVIVATWWETAEWMLRCAPAKGRHVHFVQHYEAFPYLPTDRVDAVLAAPTFKITISRWLDDLLRNRFGNDRVTLIPNSVDTDQFHAAPRGRQARPTVGMLYSEAPWKDCATGLAALAILKLKVPDLRVIAFGTTAEHPDLPLPDYVELTTRPAQDAIRDLYAQCDIWFCPSKAEGFHLPPLEAMACRCVVVSTPVGGPIDIIDEGRNGFFVPIGDPEAMADGLARVLALGDAAWQAASDAAHATALFYTWAEAADRFEAALAIAAAAPPPA